MKVGICFFGEILFMDRFMVQNFLRCIALPFQKHTPSTELFYFLHSYMGPQTLLFLEQMRPLVPFVAMTLHEKQRVVRDGCMGKEEKLFLEEYSLSRVKKMWRSYPLDLVVCVRLDTLFAKPLNRNDIDTVLDNQDHLFFAPTSTDLFRCFVMGSPLVMNLYADRVHCTGPFLEQVHSQYPIHINTTLSAVFVRVLPEGVVHPEDHPVCPYLNDLISSSSTQVRMSRRKPPKPV
jgi:hypothetical protein